MVAEKPWQAIQAADKLKVTWTPGTGLPNQSEFHESPAQSEPARDTLLVDSKDVDQKLGQRRHGAEGDLLSPLPDARIGGQFLRRGRCAGRQSHDLFADQGVWYQRSTTAMVLGLKPENVRVIFRRGSGCYGLNGADTVTYDAALLSQAVGKPVRVQLTRKDEMAWENYGNAFLMDERAGLDAQGNIVAWDHEAWSPGLGNRPGTGTPGQRDHRDARRLSTRAFHPRSPAPAPASATTTTATACLPTWRAASAASTKGTGTVKSERVLVHNVVSPFWTGPLRSPARLQNTFAHECFMDELAAQSQKPIPSNTALRHLRDARLSEVLKAAAKAANWDARPSPKPGNSQDRDRHRPRHRLRAYEGDNGYTAMVVEVEVDQDTGKVVREAHRRRQRLRTDLESRRAAQSGRRRRAAGHEPRARRRSHLGRPEGDLVRLAHLSQPAAGLRRPEDRVRC